MITNYLPTVLGAGMLLLCAISGRAVTSILKLDKLSMMGSGLIIGYSIFGLCLVASLKFIGNPFIGAIFFTVLVCVMLFFQKYNTNEIYSAIVYIKTENSIKKGIVWCNISKYTISELFIAGLLVSWVGIIALTYLPLALLTTGLKNSLPDIFDLPKHCFAMNSLMQANSWPPPSPFFEGEIFVYNYLFYYPPAFIAKLTGDSLANLQLLPLVIISVGIAMPLVILDIVRCITSSKLVQCGSVSLATWVGGLTPLWVSEKPKIGCRLLSEKLISSFVWVDELYVSVIFVPQHLFAVLCALLGTYILLYDNKTREKGLLHLIIGKNVLGGIVFIAGALSSLILLPHLVLSYMTFAVFLVLLKIYKAQNNETRNVTKYLTFSSLIFPIILIIPFLLEIFNWSKGVGAILALPRITSQWLFVASAIGTTLPLAMIGQVYLFKRRKGIFTDITVGRPIFGISFLNVVGVCGLLFAAYPDAGIKSGLWLRVCLIPIAAVGMVCLEKIYKENIHKEIVKTVIVVLLTFVIWLNYPAASFLMKSGWRPLDSNYKNTIKFIREIPKQSRIALFPSDQTLVAMIGRQIDFDFSPYRADSYMTPEGRAKANSFWHEAATDFPSNYKFINSRYDYLIVPTRSPLQEQLKECMVKIFVSEPYSVLSWKKQGDAP